MAYPSFRWMSAAQDRRTFDLSAEPASAPDEPEARRRRERPA